jgi:S-adenosylmethionine:tRNA ribosyltransferase-isomerase
VLVVNNSKTLPMRTFGKKESGGAIEVLFLKKLEQHEKNEVWEVLTKPGLKVGQLVTFEKTGMKLTCSEDLAYTKKVTLSAYEGSVVEVLHHIGHLPTPHYIRQQLKNENDYQTIYAKPEGSAATPTAGLHFTQSIFDALNKKNIQIFEVTLHVGLGTFLPVKTEDVTKHTMHKEWFTLTNEVAEKLNALKLAGKRIIAVGTTSTRTLESCAEWNEEHQTYLLKPQTGETQAFFYPPYRFKFVDALITNFHLPKSTLLMLISAFCTQNSVFTTFAESLAGKAYLEAVKKGYRFFSFGDAMLIQ